MSSSRRGFVVPDRCEAWIDLHLPPDRNPFEFQQEIDRIVAQADKYIPGLDLKVNYNFASPGYNLGEESQLKQILKEACTELGLPLRLDAFRSHSDGNLFYAAGVRPLILGPGFLETAHTPEEQVVFEEVAAAAHIYAALCLEVGSNGTARDGF
jgi:acetylornithine deacetylase